MRVCCVNPNELTIVPEKELGVMKESFTASVLARGRMDIAQCVQVDVASQGATEDEALDNLRDALELHFTPPVATNCAALIPEG
jgi:hypothetical protein